MSRVQTSTLTDLIELAKEPSSAKRRELLRKIKNTAYIAPITLALLSSEKAAGY